MWGYGAWNNLEKRGLTKENVGRVFKEGSGMIWLEKWGCARFREMEQDLSQL